MEDITKGGVLALMYILYFGNGKQRPLNVAFIFLKLHLAVVSVSGLEMTPGPLYETSVHD